MSMSPNGAAIAIAWLTIAIPTAAAADPVELSANAAVVSDYRFRGISLSDRGPAVQGGVDLETEFGLYVGTWGSTIADYEGAEVEVDFYAGFQGSAAGFDYTIGGYGYFYPGGHDVSYVEIQATAKRAVGPVTIGVEAAYVPTQNNVDAASHYLGLSGEAEIPDTGITAHVRGGYEDGFYDGKWDWEAGLAYAFGALTASLSYVDSNHGGVLEEGRLGRATVVASLLAEF